MMKLIDGKNENQKDIFQQKSLVLDTGLPPTEGEFPSCILLASYHCCKLYEKKSCFGRLLIFNDQLQFLKESYFLNIQKQQNNFQIVLNQVVKVQYRKEKNSIMIRMKGELIVIFSQIQHFESCEHSLNYVMKNQNTDPTNSPLMEQDERKKLILPNRLPQGRKKMVLGYHNDELNDWGDEFSLQLNKLDDSMDYVEQFKSSQHRRLRVENNEDLDEEGKVKELNDDQKKAVSRMLEERCSKMVRLLEDQSTFQFTNSQVLQVPDVSVPQFYSLIFSLNVGYEQNQKSYNNFYQYFLLQLNKEKDLVIQTENPTPPWYFSTLPPSGNRNRLLLNFAKSSPEFSSLDLTMVHEQKTQIPFIGDIKTNIKINYKTFFMNDNLVIRIGQSQFKNAPYSQHFIMREKYVIEPLHGLGKQGVLFTQYYLMDWVKSTMLKGKLQEIATRAQKSVFVNRLSPAVLERCQEYVKNLQQYEKKHKKVPQQIIKQTIVHEEKKKNIEQQQQQDNQILKELDEIKDSFKQINSQVEVLNSKYDALSLKLDKVQKEFQFSLLLIIFAFIILLLFIQSQ